ncbi:pirin family protein [Crocosphaera sp.]|uniref:pirin family protein n=1 Tax=Crocosphaera sp. TaxID=2729996 RepID=UPI003F251B14|nr:pirin family protein [Crocosphaera sp.]
MITVRQSQARGHANFGWLDSRHTFSFGNYYDPKHMGFGTLRVINDDHVLPGAGFGPHGHRDMEIISYVLEGELEHQDNMGHTSIIRAGDVQRISAGTGIAHSEYNKSTNQPVHFLQIWILPKSRGIEPSYEQKHFSVDQKQGKLTLVASPDGQNQSLTINQDARLYATVLNEGDRIDYRGDSDRLCWLHVAKGSVEINGETLETGDGAAITEEGKINLLGKKDNTEILLFDLG